MATLLSDNFDRADSSSVVGSPQIGPAPSTLVGTWGIASNLLYASATEGVVVWDLATMDVELSAIHTTRTDPWFGIVLCAASNTDYYLFQPSSISAALYKRVPGGFQTLVTRDLVPYSPASASDVYAGLEAYNAFDGDNATYWHGQSLEPHWIQISSPTAQISTQVTIKNYTSTARVPKDFLIQASNDGKTWTTLSTQTGITDWVDGVAKTFTYVNTTAYSYYRLYITASNGDDYINLRTIDFAFPVPVSVEAAAKASYKAGAIRCYVNGKEVIRYGFDDVPTGTKHGLRQTNSAGRCNDLLGVDAPVLPATPVGGIYDATFGEAIIRPSAFLYRGRDTKAQDNAGVA